MKIGIFDSGIGGITVLEEALRVLPHEEFIYYADSTNAPYGPQPKEVVKKYILDVVAFLSAKEIDALVIACNTATSIAVKELRKQYTFPIIGMEPAVKYALNIERDKRVLVTATELTLKEEKYQNLILKHDDRARVDSIALPKLVEIAEEGQFPREDILKYLEEMLEPYNLADYGAVVLGCTHFPYFRSYFRELLPNHVKILDGNEGTIKHLKNTLEDRQLPLNTDGGSVAFYYAGKEESQDILKRYLGRLTT